MPFSDIPQASGYVQIGGQGAYSLSRFGLGKKQ